MHASSRYFAVRKPDAKAGGGEGGIGGKGQGLTWVTRSPQNSPPVIELTPLRTIESIEGPVLKSMAAAITNPESEVANDQPDRQFILNPGACFKRALPATRTTGPVDIRIDDRRPPPRRVRFLLDETKIMIKKQVRTEPMSCDLEPRRRHPPYGHLLGW